MIQQSVQNGVESTRPASMLSITPGLVRSQFLIEIEVIAAAPHDATKRGAA